MQFLTLSILRDFFGFSFPNENFFSYLLISSFLFFKSLVFIFLLIFILTCIIITFDQSILFFVNNYRISSTVLCKINANNNRQISQYIFADFHPEMTQVPFFFKKKLSLFSFFVTYVFRHSNLSL